MNKKLTKKEREEVVTKGYLNDYLESQNYVTKQYLDEKLENYVTKDYLDERFKYYVDVLKEVNNDKFEVIFEELRAIREENSRRLEICENRLDRVESKFGIA